MDHLKRMVGYCTILNRPTVLCLSLEVLLIIISAHYFILCHVSRYILLFYGYLGSGQSDRYFSCCSSITHFFLFSVGNLTLLYTQLDWQVIGRAHKIGVEKNQA